MRWHLGRAQGGRAGSQAEEGRAGQGSIGINRFSTISHVLSPPSGVQFRVCLPSPAPPTLDGNAVSPPSQRAP